MRSIRIQYALFTLCAVLVALSIVTLISVNSIKQLGNDDADQMLSLMCTTGAMNLETYFDSVEQSTQTVAALVQSSLEDMPFDQLERQVESTRGLFGMVAYNTNGVLTYYFRIDPEISQNVKGFWYVNLDGSEFTEHEVTDITQYDTSDTSRLVWFTIPKATGKGIWLPPYYTENLDVRVVSYNVPVYWKDRFVGVIGIEIAWETLAHEVENIRLFDSGYAFLIDADSNIIFHPEIAPEQGAASIPEELLAGGDRVQYRFDGADKKAVSIPLSNGMRLFVSVPLSEISKGWQDMIWKSLLASLVLLIFVSAVILRFTSRLTKPLRDLTEAAKQVNSDHMELKTDYDTNDEIGILKSSLARLDYKASHDELTGVYNRSGYELLLSDIDIGSTCMMLFDVDDFKTINDTYGHEAGDKVLVKLARVLKNSFRAEDYVCRIGGDEFVVFLMHAAEMPQSLIVGKIQEINKELTESSDGLPPATVSVGIAHGAGASGAADLFHKTDAAMYQAKQSGKQTFKFSGQ